MKRAISRIFLLSVLLTVFFTVHGFCAQANYWHNLPQPKNLRREIFLTKTEEFLCTELYFGMKKSDGEISEAEFADFLDKIITPELPDGLTILNGIGQFRDAQNQIIKEKSKVLILLYPKKLQKEINRKIERIRKSYKQKFQQQSVLRVDAVKPVRISF